MTIKEDNAVKIALAVLELSLEDLRETGKKLSTECNIKLAEALIDEDLDFQCGRTAADVRKFSSALNLWRDARVFFVSPSSSLPVFCEVIGIDPGAVRAHLREECALPFNSMLASKAAGDYMLFRQRYANKS